MPKIVGDVVGIPNPQPDLAQTDPMKADFIKNKKVSNLENDSGFLTEHQDISGKADKNDTYTKDEIDNTVGNKIHLETTTKEDLVSAINELHQRSMLMEVEFIPENDSGIVYKVNELQEQASANSSNIGKMSGNITALYNQLKTKADKTEVEMLQAQMGDIESALDGIITIQNTLMGGDAV